MIVNAKGTRDGLTKAQIAFLDYVAGKEPSDEFTRKTSQEVYRARDKEEWRLEYMTLLQRDREKFEEGKIEGKIEGKLEELFSLVDDGLLTIDVAATRANLSIEKFSDLHDKYHANK